MTTVTTDITPEQDTALAALGASADPPVDGATYLQARIQEVLASYVQQWRIANAPITVDQGVAAFLAASPQQQTAAMVALGIAPPEPAGSPGGPP